MIASVLRILGAVDREQLLDPIKDDELRFIIGFGCRAGGDTHGRTGDFDPSVGSLLVGDIGMCRHAKKALSYILEVLRNLSPAPATLGVQLVPIEGRVRWR